MRDAPFFIALILASLMFADAELFIQPIEIGDIVTVSEKVLSGIANQSYQGEIIGFDTVYINVQKIRYNINISTPDRVITLRDIEPDKFIMWDNVTVNSYTVWNESYEASIASSQKAIYSIRSSPVIFYESLQYTQIEKGCWVCGNYIACLKRGDGYSAERHEKYKCDENDYPIIRSGESGFIENLLDGDRVAEQQGSRQLSR